MQPQLEAGAKMIKVNLPGRKHSKYLAPYYTFLGKDAVEALQEYLQNERGIPKKGEPIFLNDRRLPLNEGNIRRMFTTYVLKAGVVKHKARLCPKCGGNLIKTSTGGHKLPKRTQWLRCVDCGYLTPIVGKFHLGARASPQVGELCHRFK